MPNFEGAYDAVVSCSDARGGAGMAYLGIISISKSDIDGDNIDDYSDNCLNMANPDQMDMDMDGLGDVCDNCTEVSNFDQIDSDNDDKGDACDLCPFDPYREMDEDEDGFPACYDCDDQVMANRTVSHILSIYMEHWLPAFFLSRLNYAQHISTRQTPIPFYLSILATALFRILEPLILNIE